MLNYFRDKISKFKEKKIEYEKNLSDLSFYDLQNLRSLRNISDRITFIEIDLFITLLFVLIILGGLFK